MSVWSSSARTHGRAGLLGGCADGVTGCEPARVAPLRCPAARRPPHNLAVIVITWGEGLAGCGLGRVGGR